MCCIVILHASVLQCRVHWLLSYCYSNSHCQVKTEVINKPGTYYTCLVVGRSILCVSNIHPKLNECNDHHEHLISCWLMLFGGYTVEPLLTDISTNHNTKICLLLGFFYKSICRSDESQIWSGDYPDQ